MTPLAAVQRIDGVATGRPEIPWFRVDGRILLVKNVRSRCMQPMAAYFEPDVVGEAKVASGYVLIEPRIMNPKVVAHCDEYRSMAIALPEVVDTIRVLARGDRYAGAVPRWKEIALNDRRSM